MVARPLRCSPRSKKASTGAASRGRGVGDQDVHRGGLQRRLDAAAAGFAGELRGAASPLHKKTRGEALGMRHDIGKLGKEAKEAGNVEVHRKMRGTAAECATPTSDLCGLGARFGWGERGNGRGRGGLLIAREKERNRALIAHIQERDRRR